MTASIKLSNAVVTAVIASGKSRKDEVAAVKKAGVNKPEVERSIIIGRMAFLLKPGSNLPVADLATEVEAILALPGNTSKAKGKKRTKAQEAAYGAARTYKTRLLKEAGVKPTDARGGDNNKGKPNPGSNAPEKAEAEVVEASPKIVSTAAFKKYVQLQAVALLATIDNNPEIAERCEAEVLAIRAFHKAVIKE